jgi:hypothetical protein
LKSETTQRRQLRMATTIRPGDTLSRVTPHAGVSPKPVKHDASVQAALRKLEQQSGPTFDAKELTRAIDVGTADHDGQGAGREYADVAEWAKKNASHLTAGAKQVVAIYARAARSAQAAHQSGLTAPQRAKMLADMKKVSEPVAHPHPPPAPAPAPHPVPPPTTPHTAKEWQARALANPNHLFKCQVKDSKWNSESDAPRSSGNCGVASLAMAVEAFGLEKKGLDKAHHSKDQDTIDLVAHAMPAKTDLVNGHHTHSWRTYGPLARHGTGTYPSQIVAAASKFGLSSKYVPRATLSSLDAALAKGHMMELNGKPGAKWAKAMGYNFHGGHSVLVMGKTPDGRYLVMDPFTHKGPMKLTADQVRSFSTSGYTSVELWRAH